MRMMAPAPDAGLAQRQPTGFDPHLMPAARSGLPDVKSRLRVRGWADPGERVALKYVAIEARCRPILDIGVGTGRTTALLRSISGDYIGIDDAPEMVAMCRAQNPQAQIALMHARNLRRFEADRFALAVFSFNGIDAVSLADRLTILQEVHRVLQPNGLFLLTAHNREAVPPGQGPWGRTETSEIQGQGAWTRVRQLPDSLRNYVRQRVLHQGDDEWGRLHRAAHRAVAHDVYTTLAEQKRQLRNVGLHAELVLDNVAGRPVADDADTRAFSWLHYIARKL